MHVGPPRPRRARPVADVPIDALLRRAEDLTKGWLLALLEQASLGEAPRILATDLSREGPRVCVAVVRALADDTGLDRIGPGGALELLVSRTGELAGASGPAETARAIEALRAVIWSALADELPRPDPDQVSELAERLALVIDRVRGAALRRCEGEIEPVAAPAGGAGALSAPGAAEAAQVRATPWTGALEDEIVRADHVCSPLSLVLVELDEAERMVSVESQAKAEATFGRFAGALRSVVRRQDVLVFETEARAWVIVRNTDRAGALALGSRIESSVRSAAPWRGAPMTVSVGISVLGDDGHDATALIDAAEEAKYAAAASGRGIPNGEPGPETGEPPHEPGPRLVR